MVHLVSLVKCTRVEISEADTPPYGIFNITAHFAGIGGVEPRHLAVKIPTAATFQVGKVYDLRLEEHS